MTFKEYLVESALHEYSDEYFKVCQECFEITLAEQYLRNQMVMNESVASVGLSMEDISDVLLESTFFTESASDEELSAMYESLKEKASHAWSYCVNKVKSMLQTFGNWLLKISGKTTEQEAIIAELKMTLTKTQFDNQEAQEAIAAFQKEIAKYQEELHQAGITIENSLEECKAALNEKSKVEWHLNQEKQKSESLTKQRDNSLKQYKDAKDKIANLTKEGKAKQDEIDRLQKENQKLGNAVTEQSDIADQKSREIIALQTLCNKLKVKFSKLPMFCDPAVLCKAMTDLTNMIESGSGKANSANSIYAAVEKQVNANHEKAIVIDFSAKKFKSLADDLKAAGDKLAKYDKESGGTMNQDIHGEDYTALTKTVAYVMKVHSQTMSAINSFAAMKTKSIAPFKSLNTRLKNKFQSA